MSLRGIANGLVSNLSRVSPECQVLATPIAEPTPPTLWVLLPGDGLQYNLAMGASGGNEITAKVQGFVPLTNDAGAMGLIYDWLDTTGAASVPNAVEYDRTLAGNADDLDVVEASGPVLATVGSGPVLLAEWTVRILAVST